MIRAAQIFKKLIKTAFEEEEKKMICATQIVKKLIVLEDALAEKQIATCRTGRKKIIQAAQILKISVKIVLEDDAHWSNT